LDRNLRQSRAEEKVLGGKGVAWVARPPEVQLSRGARSLWNNGYQGGFCGAPRGVLGPTEQSQIFLRGYEVKTRRTQQSSLYELPSYLYNYMWLC